MDNSRVSYKIDEDNRVVIAEIDRCELDALEIINHRFASDVTSGFKLDWVTLKDPRYMMNRKYKAVARCCPGDEWDEELGMKIALGKLTDNYNDALNRRLCRYADALAAIAYNIDMYLDKQTP